jgi:hypothetical protein
MINLHAVLYVCLILALFQLETGPKDFIWKNRIMIIQSTDDQMVWFSESLKKDLLDRKLLVFHFNGGSIVQSNFEGELKTAEFLKLVPEKPGHPAAWVLVGLDGGVKNSGYSIPNPGEIFRIIDAMPMRQSERVRKGNQDNSSNK